ncbi:MAG: hypothetical protein ACSLFI_01870 [Solirubrobacterales bacterium]
MGIPGKKASEPATPPAPLTRLEERREDLREKFAEMQWDLGGAAYEMAARDYFRLDVLASMASRLQVVDAELAEIERMARLERAGAAGSCSGCGSLYARGAVYCWRCGRNLSANGGGTVVGPSAAGQIAMHSVPATSPNGTDDAETTNVTPLTEVPPVQEATTEPEVVVEQAPGPPDDPDPEPASNFRPAPGGRRP